MRCHKPALGRSLLAAALACFLMAWLSPPCGAQTPAPEQPAARLGPKDPAELEAFLDGVMAAHKEAHHISGATVAVVRDGKLFLAKGYGYADVARKTRVEPDKTLFRIGSVSKLFTWTAVMQLVEQGKLDLNADLNAYLTKFQIPATYPQPITMAHLLTHTPGFEDHVIGLFARSPDQLIPLGNLLARELPARVRPPGELASYSNYGTALAGYVIAQVSGMPWEAYLEKNLLQPLEMAHTTVRQPIPTPLAGDMAVGYTYDRGEFKARDFEYVPLAPAGSMSAAATDMAHFMVAHLEGGRYGSAYILSDATARQMHSRLFAHAPQVNGVLHGFYEMNRNGQRIFGHGGDTFWFHTVLMLLPDQNLGLFASYNSDTGAKARSELVSAFLDHYYPAPESPTPKPAADFRDRARRFEGSYAAIRISETTLAKLARLFAVINVRANEEARLLTTSPGDEPKRWVEAKPLIFREVDGPDTIVFREDNRGRITHLFLSSFPPIAFVKLAPSETPLFHLVALTVCALLFLSGLVLWPISALRNRRRAIRAPTLARLARVVGWAACALFVAFLIGMAAVMANPTEIAFGLPPLLRKILLLPVVAAALMIAVLTLALLAWKRGLWGVAARVHYTLIALTGLAFLWWLNYWNLLGYRF